MSSLVHDVIFMVENMMLIVSFSKHIMSIVDIMLLLFFLFYLVTFSFLFFLKKKIVTSLNFLKCHRFFCNLYPFFKVKKLSI